jgi:hypothetical protein
MGLKRSGQEGQPVLLTLRRRRGLVTARWLGWSLVMTCTISSGAPASVPLATVAVKTEGPSPGLVHLNGDGSDRALAWV